MDEEVADLKLQQERNLKNREEFLNFIKGCAGKEASIRMFDTKNPLKATVRAFDPGMNFVGVSDLQTPLGVNKNAVLRMDDIVEIVFDPE